MIRSYLFVPGNRPDRFEKARRSGADAIVLDLEDAVSIEDKVKAREAVAAWLSPDHPAYVRINGAATEWFPDDLEAIDLPGLAGVVLPKSESPQQILDLVERLSARIGVFALVETALGVWEARALAETTGVERLAFGSVDFLLDAGIEGDDTELLYARSRLVLASRAAGIQPPVDGVTTALDDAGRLAADVARARRLGFGVKLCIHPTQITAVNQGYLPTNEEVSWARRVLETLRGAEEGALRIDGEFVDRPVVERARSVMARAGSGAGGKPK